MATPSVYQKISQRVKNANLKLTTDSGTHLPFMKRVNSIIKEFDAEKAVELFFRAPWQDEPRRNKPIESARVRAAILDLSKEDFKSALEQTPMEKKKVEIATSILTGAIPTDYDFLWEEKDHPVKIYSSLGHELFPGDANATNELWDELDDLDFADYDRKVSKLTAAINRIHKRLKDCGEDLSTGRKVAALIKALRPKSKYAQIIFEMKKQTWASFTKAQSRLESLLKTWADLQPSSSKQTAEEAIVNTNGNCAPSGSNSEALMFAQFKKFMNSNRNQAHAQRGGWRGRRGGGGRGRGRGGRKRGPRRDHTNTQCWNCGGRGHYAKNCPTSSSYRDYLNFKSTMNNPNSKFFPAPKEKKQKVIDTLTIDFLDDSVVMPDVSKANDAFDSFALMQENVTGDDVNSRINRRYFSVRSTHACTNDLCMLSSDETLLPMFLCAKNNKNMNDALCKPCMDSGASTCFFNNLKHFQTLKTIPEVNVSLGEQGRSYPVNKMGDVHLQTKVHGRTNILKLKDVIYAPQAPGNFISLSYLDRRMGMKINVANGCMDVFSKKNTKVARAPLNKMTNLYNLSCEILLNPRWRDTFSRLIGAPLRLNALTTAELMHRRFGHCGLQMLNRTLRKLKVSTVRPVQIRCTACDLTGTKRPQVRDARKRKRHASRKLTHTHTQDNESHDSCTTTDQVEAIRAINSDVKTMPRSRRGYKFFAVFVEQLTRFCLVNKFKTKSELANAAISALKFVEKQGTCTIVEFKSDYESIYKCHKLTSYLDENGIKFSPSTPHRHEQNGIAERVIQTLLRKMRANLKQCGLSNHFWCYALDAAVFVYNRTLHGATNKIPSMEFSKESVQLDSLVVFGCIGVCHIDEEKRSSRHDIDRATLVRMLGYDEHNRDGTYLVCDLKGKTFRARVTKWCEDVYSFAEMLKQLPIKKPRNRRHVANADEQLRRDEAKLREEIECEEKQEKDTERRVSRSNRIRKNRLRFIPGVNYAPMMHHMNALLDADAKDCSGTHESNNADPVENLMLFVESMMKERHAASKHESKWEHWLTNIQMSAQEVLKVPKTFREAVTGPEKESWIPSIKSELKSHVDNGTWRVIERRRMKNTVKMKWVFRKKINADGSIRYKSRLVVCGYSQIEGEDYFNTHAPTLSLGSLRILIAIASRFKLNLHNIDIKTAFLYGMIDADINCEIPGGIAEFLADSIANFSDPVLQLQRAIYGLKQAGYVWLQTYMRSLKSWGFKQCQTDPCVFMKRMNGRVLITAVYVDDTIIMHQSNADLNWLLKQIGKHYQFTNEGELRWALGTWRTLF